MKALVRGALCGVLFAAAWLAMTAGPEIEGQSPSFVIGWLGGPLVVFALIGAAIGGFLALISRAAP